MEIKSISFVRILRLGIENKRREKKSLTFLFDTQMFSRKVEEIKKKNGASLIIISSKKLSCFLLS